jgi:hypothetical protein
VITGHAMTEGAAGQPGIAGDHAMSLGVLAFLFGLGAAAAGAWLGFATQGALVVLPGGLPAMPPATLGIAMLAIGLMTMMLGALSIYRAQEG